MNDNDMLIIDQMIDDDSIRIWTCFTDKNVVNALSSVPSFQQLSESEALTGKEWNKLPFWGKLRDWVVPGKNLDGTRKNWFENRKFPVKTIKAEDLTAKLIKDTLNDGFGIKLDISTATDEQRKQATYLMSKAFDTQFMAIHGQAAKDASNLVGGTATVAANIVGGPEAGLVAGIATKGAIMDAEQKLVIDKFNDSVKGTEFEDLAITKDDLNYSWFDTLVNFVYSHPYASLATVVALVLVWKNRTWIWDRLKLGFNNLWQGKIIAKYKFQLVDEQALSFEYDLRFNKWRLLYQDFKWRGYAYPGKSMMVSFIATEHCKKFIEVCKKHMNDWFEHEDELRNVVAMNKDPKFKEPIKMILAVLDDKEDILRSFTQLEYKVG